MSQTVEISLVISKRKLFLLQRCVGPNFVQAHFSSHDTSRFFIGFRISYHVVVYQEYKLERTDFQHTIVIQFRVAP